MKIQIYLLTDKNIRKSAIIIIFICNVSLKVENNPKWQVLLSLLFCKEKSEVQRGGVPCRGSHGLTVQSWETNSHTGCFQTSWAAQHYKSLKILSLLISKAHKVSKYVMSGGGLFFFLIYKTEWFPWTTPGNIHGDIHKLGASVLFDFQDANTWNVPEIPYSQPCSHHTLSNSPVDFL